MSERPDIVQTEYRTIILMPWGEDTRTHTFTVLAAPPIKTGRTKVFPGRATMGPTDPDRDDTLTTLNFMDISGGQGVYTINPASDLGNYWWGIASAEGTDGWTAAREAILTRPTGAYSGACVPLGRVGSSIYALWGTGVYRWNPDARNWGSSLGTLPATLTNYEGTAYLNETLFIPYGTAGYSTLSESAPGTLVIGGLIAGADAPTYAAAIAEPSAKTNPRPLMFCAYHDTLWAVTIKSDGYKLVASLTGATNTWEWKQVADTSWGKMIALETSFEPKSMAVFPNAQNDYNLWVAGKRGLKSFESGQSRFTETSLVNPPPHPDFGRCMQVFRPGEALWIAGGGGDLVQYTVGGGVVPASGPGGAREGLPAGRRGSVISMATDLFHLYAYIQGEPAFGTAGTIVEDDPAGDPMYIPSATAISSVIANTGKGWHPLWESDGPGKVPSRIVVADTLRGSGAVDYRTFWGIGDECWTVVNRLSTHSSRQAVQTGTGERFRCNTSNVNRAYCESFLEWGRFNGGSIANNKLASHAALVMEHATPPVEGSPNTGDYVEYWYYTDRDHEEQGNNPPWRYGGRADRDSEDSAGNPTDPRTVLPFGLITNAEGMPVFSQGESFRWIRQRLRFVSNSATYPPIVTAMTLAFLPLPQDAATKSYSVLLPVERDAVTGHTAEFIIRQLESMLSPTMGEEHFLFLQDGQEKFRAYISSISYGRAPTSDGPGALTLTVIQIPSGLPTLVGEPFPDLPGVQGTNGKAALSWLV